MTKLRLPGEDGKLRLHTLRGPRPPTSDAAPLLTRAVYAAAHVVADPLGENTPGAPAAVDWEATLAFRRHLWAHGLGVADAMDTAQRGMGLDWPATQELIRRSGAEACAVGGRLLCGASTDQLPPGPATLQQVVEAYAEQCALIERAGAKVVLMASPHLAATAKGPDDYSDVYSKVLEQVSGKVVLHWLGPMFDPALAGYWGSVDVDQAMLSFGQLITEHSARIDGIKVSLLDAEREVRLRRLLPQGVRCYTGDDFHYPELIRGDEEGYSDALLGVFDAIAPVAAAAVRALDSGHPETFDSLLAPTVPLSRHMFRAPTFHYKTGIVFLAWLTGQQDHFVMVGGLQSCRSVPHLARLLVLADDAGVLPDPELAAARMRQVLAVAGIDA